MAIIFAMKNIIKRFEPKSELIYGENINGDKGWSILHYFMVHLSNQS